MKIATKLRLLLLLSASIFACNKSGDNPKKTVSEVRLAAQSEMVMENSGDNLQKEASQKIIPQSATSVEKKIIKDGTLTIKSEKIGESKKNIDLALKSVGAYYESENLTNDEQQISYDLKIRVPAVNLEKLLSTIEKGDDEIRNKNIQARDVTEEFIDLNSRLASKQVYLKRYKELLNKATTIKNILEIEEQIRMIQEELESTQGRLKYLNNQVSLSTLSINLYQTKEYIFKPTKQNSFGERFKKAIASGWNAIVTFLIVLISIWPFIILLVVVVYFFRKYRLWRKRNIEHSFSTASSLFSPYLNI